MSIPNDSLYRELSEDHIGLDYYFIGGQEKLWETTAYTGPKAWPLVIERSITAESGDMYVQTHRWDISLVLTDKVLFAAPGSRDRRSVLLAMPRVLPIWSRFARSAGGQRA